MKNLIFGALLLSSVSVMATPVDHSMHSDTETINLHITSQGSEIDFVPCTESEMGYVTFLGAILLGDGAESSAVHTLNPSYVLRSLHYNSKFTACAKVQLTGGYAFLDDYGYFVKFNGNVDVQTDAGSYVVDSGLKVKAGYYCVNSPVSTLWNLTAISKTDLVSKTVAGDLAAWTNVQFGGLFNKGLPSACYIGFAFTETSGTQRQNTSGDSVDSDLNLMIEMD